MGRLSRRKNIPAKPNMTDSCPVAMVYTGKRTKGGDCHENGSADRILSILLQREQVTAPELAEQFEVSRRTHPAGHRSPLPGRHPITTAQGAGGGISIMEGYRVDRTVLTAPEMQAILAGLRSLDSVSGTRRYAQLMEKLSAGNSTLISGGTSHAH